MNCKSSAAMWARLEALYEQKNTTNVHLKLQKFYEYKMEPSDSIANHVSKVESMASQLLDLGHEQTPMAIVTKVLHGLPKNFRHVIAAWDSVPEEKRTLQELVPRLLKEESLCCIWDKEVVEESAALFHRSGNNSQQNRQNQQGQQNKTDQGKKGKKKKGSCHYCKKPGHYIAECRKRIAEEKAAQANVSKTTEDSGQAFTAGALSVSSNEDTWLADYGASEHMSHLRGWFSSFKDLGPNDMPIYVGNNAVIYARGRGDIEVDTLVSGQWEPHTIRDVLYVPDIGKNLFSLGAAADKGVTARIEIDKCFLEVKGSVVAEGVSCNSKLYKLLMRTKVSEQANAASSVIPLQVWHERLGHVNYQTLQGMASAKDQMVVGLGVI